MLNRIIPVGILILIILLAVAGCNSMHVGFFAPRNRLEKEGDVEETADPVPPGVIESCGQVPGPVMKLQLTLDRKFLAVLWQDPQQAKPSNRREQTNWKASLFDVEFNRSKPEAEHELGQVSSVFSTGFDEESKRLFIADASTDRGRNAIGKVKPNIRVFEPVANRCYSQILSDDFDEERIRLSHNAHWIACRDRIGSWRLIDREEPDRVVVFPELEVDVASETFESPGKRKCHVTEILAFSPQNDFVATLVSDLEEGLNPSGNSDESESGVYRTIVIWDLLVVDSIKLEDAKKLPLEAIMVSMFRAKDGVERRRCAFSPDGTMIAVRSKSRYIGVWQTANGQLFAELGEHKERITSLAFSPNSLELLVGTGGTCGQLLLWDIRKEAVTRFYKDTSEETTGITAVAFSPDGYTAWFGTNTGQIKTWQIRE